MSEIDELDAMVGRSAVRTEEYLHEENRATALAEQLELAAVRLRDHSRRMRKTADRWSRKGEEARAARAAIDRALRESWWQEYTAIRETTKI